MSHFSSFDEIIKRRRVAETWRNLVVASLKSHRKVVSSDLKFLHDHPDIEALLKTRYGVEVEMDIMYLVHQAGDIQDFDEGKYDFEATTGMSNTEIFSVLDRGDVIEKLIISRENLYAYYIERHMNDKVDVSKIRKIDLEMLTSVAIGCGNEEMVAKLGYNLSNPDSGIEIAVIRDDVNIFSKLFEKLKSRRKVAVKFLSMALRHSAVKCARWMIERYPMISIVHEIFEDRKSPNPVGLHDIIKSGNIELIQLVSENMVKFD